MKETKQLYLKIKDTLLAGGVIKRVEMYANQITRLVPKAREGNGTGVIGMPAVLVEFMNIDYFQKGNRHQEFTATIRLHTCVYGLVDPGFLMFDVLANVHRTVDQMYTENTTPLLRMSDNTDNDYTNLVVNMTDYQFRGTVVPEPTVFAAVNAIDIHINL